MSSLQDVIECLDLALCSNSTSSNCQQFDCRSTIPTCKNSARFDFPSLQQITEGYFNQCGSDGPWLVQGPGSHASLSLNQAALTGEACKAIAGTPYTPYPGGDVWQRLTTWKIPLFQLVANSPRPPLGRSAEAFTFVHFLGDPIGTATDVLRKVDGCQSRAVFWQSQLEGRLALLNEGLNVPGQQRIWKSLAIIVDSFDEWGLAHGDMAQKYLSDELARLCLRDSDGNDMHEDIREKFVKCCLQTGDALAADRATAFVPVAVAQGFFIGAVAVAAVHVAATQGPPPQTYINIEMWSIGFTAQYFWVIFVVFWKSIVGTSQTMEAIPRILRRFQRDLQAQGFGKDTKTGLPVDELNSAKRKFKGGLYSWQPTRRWAAAGHNSAIERRTNGRSDAPTSLERFLLATVLRYWPTIQCCIPFLAVALAAATGQIIIARVAPVDWSCRGTAMMWMFVAWIASYTISLAPVRGDSETWFWITFVKDFVIMSINFGIVIATQIGIYNKCDCYTKYDRVGLQLPVMPAVDALLRSRLKSDYPVIIAIGIAIQLIFLPGLLMWRYHAAVQVFLQRDDGSSNVSFWHGIRERRMTQHTLLTPVTTRERPAAAPTPNSPDQDEDVTVQEIEEVRSTMEIRDGGSSRETGDTEFTDNGPGHAGIGWYHAR